MLFEVDIKERTTEKIHHTAIRRQVNGLRYYYIEDDLGLNVLAKALEQAREKLASYYRVLDDYQKPSTALGVVRQINGHDSSQLVVKAATELQNYLAKELAEHPLKRKHDWHYE